MAWSASAVSGRRNQVSCHPLASDPAQWLIPADLRVDWQFQMPINQLREPIVGSWVVCQESDPGKLFPP